MKKVNWNDISIGMHMKMDMIRSMQASKVEKYIQLVGLIHGIENVKDLTMNEYQKYMATMEDIQVLPEMATRVEKEKTIKGKKFTLLVDIGNMTGGQFIDFSVIKERKKMDEMLAVLYTREGMSFKERADWIREHETIGSAYPYLRFFLHYTAELQKRIPAYSQSQKMRTPAALQS